jgi:hypothetical protein
LYTEESIPVCMTCAETNLNTTFTDKHLRYIQVPGKDTLFYEYDNETQTTTTYKLCPLSDLGSLESFRIIKANGRIFDSCIPGDTALIKVESFEPVDYCTPPLQVVEGEFAVTGTKWYVYSISVASLGTVSYQPCESLPEHVAYLVNDMNNPVDFVITGFSGSNTFSFRYRVHPVLIGDFIFDVNVTELSRGTLRGTTGEQLFETQFFDILKGVGPNQTLAFIGSNNTLTIKSRKGTIKCFAK